jgi:L-asparaginase
MDARPDLPRILVLATGGTIAGKQRDPKSAGYEAGAVCIDSLISAVPESRHLASISGEQVFNIGSQDMNTVAWLKLAHLLNAKLKDPKVDGVVITHGTDTMEETGYFLNLVTKSTKPVVLVGSMRPSTSIGADGKMNFYNAVAVAADPQAAGRGVLITMNDEVFSARNATKVHTTRLDAFQSPNRRLAGLVTLGKIDFFAPPANVHTTQSEFSVEGLADLPRVDIIYAYAGMGREFIDFSVKSGARGIVLAGLGGGNASKEAIHALGDAVRHGVVVVRSTRVGSGIVARNMEVDDEKHGFITSMEINPQKARILLMLGLTRTGDAEQLQEYFRQY